MESDVIIYIDKLLNKYPPTATHSSSTLSPNLKIKKSFIIEIKNAINQINNGHALGKQPSRYAKR